MTEWEEFFEKHQGYSVQASFYECRRDFTMDELYQAFKARLLWELTDASTSYGNDELTIVLNRAASSASGANE